MNNKMYTISIILIALLSIEINVYSISEKNSVSLNYYDCSKDIPSDIYEWSDGSFNGYWRNEGSEEEGDFNGYLKLGRRPDIGIFFGDWWYLDESAPSRVGPPPSKLSSHAIRSGWIGSLMSRTSSPEVCQVT